MRELAIGAALLLAGCGAAQAERVQLSGRAEQRSVTVSAFDKVELKGPDRVVVRVGGSPSVTMAGDGAVLDRLRFSVKDGQLIVERDGRGWTIGGERERATVTITVPRLAAASVGGSGEMSVDRVGGGDFAAAVGGSGALRVGEARANKLEAAVGGSGALRFDRVDADSVEMAIGGSGSIDAAGRARSVKAAIGGSGNVEAKNLVARTAAVSIAGSGDAAVNASDDASVATMGSGNVTVHGGARCQTTSMGSGRIRCASKS